MKNIHAKELKIKFVESLSNSEGFDYDEENPFLAKIYGANYYIYLKNLSPAYLKSSPDVTRVQLPYNDRFSEIFKTDIPFVIIGYDIDNDVMVCWNPIKIKERLNAKSNVSLYSRESLQKEVRVKEFSKGYLSTGEFFIVFKRQNLSEFFQKIRTLFDDEGIQKSDSENKPKGVQHPHTSARFLDRIEDKNLIKIIRPLLKKNKVLEAVSICQDYYEGQYKNMSFKDWFKIVKKLYQELNR